MIHGSIYKSRIKHTNLLQNIQVILPLKNVHTMYNLSYLNAKEILQPAQILSLQMRVHISLQLPNTDLIIASNNNIICIQYQVYKSTIRMAIKN